MFGYFQTQVMLIELDDSFQDGSDGKINNYNSLDVSVRFIKNIKYVDKIVIGVDNLSQLEKIVKSYKKNLKIKLKKFIQSQLLKNSSTW